MPQPGNSDDGTAEARAFGWTLSQGADLRLLVTATDEELAEVRRQLVDVADGPPPGEHWTTYAIALRILANRLERRFGAEVKPDGSVWVKRPAEWTRRQDGVHEAREVQAENQRLREVIVGERSEAREARHDQLPPKLDPESSQFKFWGHQHEPGCTDCQHNEHAINTLREWVGMLERRLEAANKARDTLAADQTLSHRKIEKLVETNEALKVQLADAGKRQPDQVTDDSRFARLVRQLSDVLLRFGVSDLQLGAHPEDISRWVERAFEEQQTVRQTLTKELREKTAHNAALKEQLAETKEDPRFAELVKRLDGMRIRFGNVQGATIADAMENTLSNIWGERAALRVQLLELRGRVAAAIESPVPG